MDAWKFSLPFVKAWNLKGAFVAISLRGCKLPVSCVLFVDVDVDASEIRQQTS